MKYQGKNVTSRDAKQGDPNYDANRDQVVIAFEDKTEKTVDRPEVTN